MICIYPGSFDPLTKGHEDILARASAIFDEVVFALLCNPRKNPVIPETARMNMMKKLAAPYPNVRVECFSGLLAEFARQQHAQVILRGVRSAREAGAELDSAFLNRCLYAGAETLFIPASPGLSAYSSSAVRELAAFGGDYRSLLPDCLADEISIFLSKTIKEAKP